MLRILEKSVRFSLDLGIRDLILGKVLEIREQGKRDTECGIREEKRNERNANKKQVILNSRTFVLALFQDLQKNKLVIPNLFRNLQMRC